MTAPDDAFGPGENRPEPKDSAFSRLVGLLSRIAVGAALALIGFYRLFLSPLWPPVCRFYPSCSAYSARAFQIHGFWRGAFLTARRLSRCHPFRRGGYDPVPEKTSPPEKRRPPKLNDGAGPGVRLGDRDRD